MVNNKGELAKKITVKWQELLRMISYLCSSSLFLQDMTEVYLWKNHFLFLFPAVIS